MTIAETVALLDYSRPPPGYTAPVPIGEEWHVVGPQFAENFATEALALAAAWTHHKAHNDPPGIETVPTMGQGAAFVMPYSPLWAKRGAAIVLPWVGIYPTARAAAWAWHDCRHALAERGLAYRGRWWAALAVWPRCLTWSDEQVTEVEHWLADSTAETPAVLR